MKTKHQQFCFELLFYTKENSEIRTFLHNWFSKLQQNKIPFTYETSKHYPSTVNKI